MNRDDFILALKKMGIGTSVHYRPLHQMKVWEPFCEGILFPDADEVFEQCLSLPLFMAMTDAEQDRVIDVVRNLLAPQL